MTSIPTSEHAEFHATTWSAIISKTKGIFWIFSCISKMCIKFRTFWQKKDEYRNLVISRIIDSERGGYLNV